MSIFHFSAHSAERANDHNSDLIEVVLGTGGESLGTWMFIPGFGDVGNGAFTQRLIRGLASNLDGENGTLRFIGASDRHSDYDKYLEDSSHSVVEKILSALSEDERKKIVLTGYSMGANRAIELAENGNLVIALSPTDIPKSLKKVPLLIVRGKLDDMTPFEKLPHGATIHELEDVGHGLQHYMGGSVYDEMKTRALDHALGKIMLDFVRLRKKRK